MQCIAYSNVQSDQISLDSMVLDSREPRNPSGQARALGAPGGVMPRKEMSILQQLRAAFASFVFPSHCTDSDP